MDGCAFESPAGRIPIEGIVIDETPSLKIMLSDFQLEWRN
jgi:hypothetical protein